MEEITIKINKTAVFLVGGLIVGLALGYSGGVYRTNARNSQTPAQEVVAGNQQNTETQQPTATVTMDQIKGLFNGENITFGKKNSKVVFVEISDPSCPYCQVAAGKNPSLNQQAGSQFVMVADGGSYLAPVPEMKKLVDQGKAAFAWIYANGHGSGEMGAKALYCANEKGKFWQAHDLLMTAEGYNLLNNVVKNDKTKSGELANFLKSAIGYDMSGCLENGKYDNQLAKDAGTATQLGFGGTPYFLVNTTSFEGAHSYTSMQAVVDEALK
ncbi:MAG: DsbA family protein [Patescibacteria group bacterium]